MVIQGVNFPSDFEAKKTMIEIGRRMDEKGYVIAGDGSLSVRVGPNAVWITAEGADKGAMKQDCFVRVDLNGRQMPGSRGVRLPEDLPIHLQAYSQNPELRGIVHAYPAGAVALTVRGEEVSPADYTPAVRALGRITFAAAANAEAAAKEAALVCKTDSGILLSGNGCVMWGKNVMEAFQKLQALEYYVKLSRLLCAGEKTSGCTQGWGEGNADSRAYSLSPVQRAGELADESPAASEALPIEGLTPLIKPGEGAGVLPQGTPATAQKSSASASDSIAASRVPAFASGPAASRVPAAAPALTRAAAPASAVHPQSAALHGRPAEASGAAKLRNQTMAEVVRRSLAAMK